MNNSGIIILMADDDPDDRLLTRDAFLENKLQNTLLFVNDGVELMDYLLQRGAYNSENAPRPGLILLDLNMPKMDGREALSEIKQHPDLKRIPVVILTTSKADEDILESYNLGVNSFICKPVSFNRLVEVTARLGEYWLQIVKLPSEPVNVINE